MENIQRLILVLNVIVGIVLIAFSGISFSQTYYLTGAIQLLFGITNLAIAAFVYLND